MKRAACAIAVGVVAAGCSVQAAPAPSRAAPGTATSSASPGTQSPTNAFTGRALISKATWTTTSKGRELQVVPTQAGRTDFVAGEEKRAWSEVLVKAPDAGSPGMYDQFLCHWNFARIVDPGKPSWNLEPWRPAVGYARVVAASCNPGGSEG